MIQTFVGLAELFIAVTICLIFWKVASTTKEKEDYAKVMEKGYAIRAKYYKSLLIVAIVTIVASFVYLPYPRFAKGRVEGDVTVYKVLANQFSFIITDESDNEVDVISKGAVRFDVTSEDVNHGFGVYSPEGVIFANVQMMPDYINKLYVQFDEPGTYTIWCMEYCGMAHHVMQTEIEVK